MGRVLLALVAIAPCLALGAPPAAAVPTEFTGSFTLSVAQLLPAGLPFYTGAVAGTADVAGDAVTLPPGLIAIDHQVDFDPCGTGAAPGEITVQFCDPLYTGLRITLTSTGGSVGPGGTGPPCPPPLPGGEGACATAGGVGGDVPVDGNLLFVGGFLNGSTIPLALGRDALTVDSPTGVVAQSTGWTTGTVTVLPSVASGGPYSISGGQSGPVGPGGTLRLASGANVDLASLAAPSFLLTLDLVFVPEPATALLVGVGLLGLGLRRGRWRV